MAAKVLIVGAGPSAAYAAQACLDNGVMPTVVSNTEPSVQQDGAFFLHWVPEAWKRSYKPVLVKFHGVGSAEWYSTKQWGRDVPTSFPKEMRIEEMWQSQMVAGAWQAVPVSRVLKLSDADLFIFGRQHDFVFYTFTAAAHKLSRTVKWFPVRTYFNRKPDEQFEILYNGKQSDFWVRMTQSFDGRVSFEFPDTLAAKYHLEFDEVWQHMQANHLRDIAPNTQPVAPEEYMAANVIPLGRFATWDRKRLSHHAYDDVVRVLQGERVLA